MLFLNFTFNPKRFFSSKKNHLRILQIHFLDHMSYGVDQSVFLSSNPFLHCTIFWSRNNFFLSSGSYTYCLYICLYWMAAFCETVLRGFLSCKTRCSHTFMLWPHPHRPQKIFYKFLCDTRHTYA